MIEIGSPRAEMDPRFASAPGGFAWWYADLVAPGGDGLVLIWSFGLPFLPGYAAASRAGRPQRPLDRPSVNLAVYRSGRPVFYLLQEYEPEAGYRPDLLVGGAERNGSSGAGLRIGSSWFESRERDGRRLLEARLDCAIPGTSERLAGTVRVDGVAPLGEASEIAGAPHVWTPLTGPAQGTAELSVGGRGLVRVQGRAYHDRNGGAVPLHSLGMSHWAWGRFPFRGRERIYYLLWPHGAGGEPLAIGIEIDEVGEQQVLRPLGVEVLGERRTYLGLHGPRRLRLRDGARRWLDVEHTAIVDNGPFYLRYFSEATDAGGERVTGFGELCYPDRVDRALHRPLVRMAVHRVGGRNSPWLPLFSGPRSGRIRRLLGSLASRSAAGGTGGPAAQS